MSLGPSAGIPIDPDQLPLKECQWAGCPATSDMAPLVVVFDGHRIKTYCPGHIEQRLASESPPFAPQRPPFYSYQNDALLEVRDRALKAASEAATKQTLRVIELEKLLDRDRIAEVFHEAWMHWVQVVSATEPGISLERRTRWTAQYIPYSQLTDEQKDLDRKWADRVLGRPPP